MTIYKKSEANSQKIALVVKFANIVIQIGHLMGRARVQLLQSIMSPKFCNCVFSSRETCFSRKRESFGGLSLLNQIGRTTQGTCVRPGRGGLSVPYSRWRLPFFKSHLYLQIFKYSRQIFKVAAYTQQSLQNTTQPIYSHCCAANQLTRSICT